ncbi:hypothetical protein ACE6H2_019248 [Prunus campanulata]
METNVTRGQADFDPSAPPPFKIAEIRDAIPKHCWVKNPWTSLSYAVRDIFVIFALSAIAKYSSTWYVWPFYWAVQGAMFWAVFVIGHDCGHGSFSDSRWLNSFVGHILHSAILVPFHGWRISHKTHHQNHGHVENDESWVPIFVMWLDIVTYLHHHGYETKLPWYRGETKAAKHVLGKYYREPEKSGPIPFHLAKILTASLKEDHYVSDTGHIVYYQTDSKRLRFYEKMKPS